MHPRGIRMNFDWSEYLNLAQELAGQTGSPAINEAKLRSSVSRAYYAVFCKARNYLRDVDGDTSIPKTGKAHRYVISKFKNSMDRRRRQIGVNLDRLRTDRRKVDYDDFVTGLSPMAVMDLRLAQQVNSTLKSL